MQADVCTQKMHCLRVSKASLHCNSTTVIEFVPVSPVNFQYSIRNRSYSWQPLSCSFCFLIAIRLIEFASLFNTDRFQWIVKDDRHWGTTSLFNIIQGRCKTIIFHNTIISSRCWWDEYVPSFHPSFFSFSVWDYCTVYLCSFSLCWCDFFIGTLPFSAPEASQMVITL